MFFDNKPMNVLFVTYDFPYPMTSGGKNRAFHLLKYAAKKANIYLYSFVREDYNPESNAEVLHLGVKEIRVFKRKKLNSISNIPNTIFNNSSIFRSLYFEKKVVEELKEIIREKDIDIVHYESSYTGFFLPSLHKMHVKQILGTENIEFQLYQDYAKFMKKFYLRPFVLQQAMRLKKEELEMVIKADKVTVVTNQEKEILKELTGVKVDIVANGIEPDRFAYSFNPKLRNNILFVGNFTYFPNIDAVNFFYHEVFKKIKRDVTFTIVGKQVTSKFNFDDRRIIVKDFVENIEEEYKKADLLVFPIRIGGGTNFKVLEAMSLGVPIVAKPERLEGFDAVSGEHFLEANNAEEYISQIDLLYDDPVLREKIAKNARRLIEKNFGWEKIGQDLLEVWTKAL